MQIDATSVDDYLNQVPPARQSALRRIRTLIQTIAPDLEENLAYGMPTYWVGGQFLCAFASQKNYMSLYLDQDLLAIHRAALGTLSCGKSCVRFTRIECLPLDTITTILTQTYAQRQQ